MSKFDCDVLVVGLGPTGDVMSALLKQLGLSVVAVDREAAIYPLPRAATFDAEIMRIFQMIGAAEAIEPHCRPPTNYRFQTASGEALLEFPTPQAVGKWGWMPIYFLHQPAVEGGLRDRLAALGVDMRTRTRFLTADQDDTGVTVALEGGDGPYTIRARYVVGCDGAGSPVRERIGGGIDDYQFDEPWLVVDAIVAEPGDLPQIALQICDPQRPTTYMRMCGDRYRWEFMIKPGEDPEWFASDESLRGLLEPWNVLDRATIDRRAVYRFHGLVANRWRHDRLLIAGDAAHQMPPFAGQGMCSGIRDAVNLGWKLAAVVKGEADDGLLDTYQTEREPHVRHIIETSIAMGKTVCVLDPAAAAARDEAMLARKAAGEQDVSIDYPGLHGGCLMDQAVSGELFIQPVAGGHRLDDALGKGPWLIGSGLPASHDVPEFELDDARLAMFHDDLARWLTDNGGPAVFVRPDRHIFGVGRADQLLAAWERALRPSSDATMSATDTIIRTMTR